VPDESARFGVDDSDSDGKVVRRLSALLDGPVSADDDKSRTPELPSPEFPAVDFGA
jgi:hypothetical protein